MADISYTLAYDGTEWPILFASESLIGAEWHYAQVNKEDLILVWGVKNFNQYEENLHLSQITNP